MVFRRYRQPYRPRSRLRQMLDFALTAVLFALLTLVIVRLEQFSTRKENGAPVVADGDTLVFNGAKVRMEGIDAPEFTQTCQKPGGAYPCGREARSQLVKLVSGRPVSCEGWQVDKYGRLLVTCRAGTTELNREMVRTGWAVAYGAYEPEETAARSAGLGIWQGQFERPSTFRKTKGDLVEPAETPHDLWFKLKQAISRLLEIG